MRHEQTILIAEPAAQPSRHMYPIAKRALDLAVSLAALLLALPLLLLLALLIKLDSPGPVLFRQQRLGRNGRPFTFYKFRTMHHDADPAIHRQYVERLIREQAAAEDGPAQGPKRYKLSRDPRITRVGRLLRRSSLDEFPQFFNVLKGDMSLVGPRPPLPYEVQFYEEWHMGRLAALPGISGLWQVRGRSRVTFDEMVAMDLEYIAQQSFWLDLKILALTLPAVLLGAGAE